MTLWNRYVFCRGEPDGCIAVDLVGVLGVSMIVGLWWALTSRAWRPSDPPDS